MRVRGLAAHLLAHPRDAWVVARAAWRLRRDGWWRRPPFVPRPGDAWMRFRVTTALADAAPTPRDVVSAARWAVGSRAGK